MYINNNLTSKYALTSVYALTSIYASTSMYVTFYLGLPPFLTRCKSETTYKMCSWIGFRNCMVIQGETGTRQTPGNGLSTPVHPGQDDASRLAAIAVCDQSGRGPIQVYLARWTRTHGGLTELAANE